MEYIKRVLGGLAKLPDVVQGEASLRHCMGCPASGLSATQSTPIHAAMVAAAWLV
jgi:hypothetical protein